MSKRYIDADKLIKRLNASPAFPNVGTDGFFLLGVVEDLVRLQPTADVAEVVRCKDCTEWDAKEQECSHWYGFRADDFCSHGIRREENEG